MNVARQRVSASGLNRCVHTFRLTFVVCPRSTVTVARSRTVPSGRSHVTV